MNTRNESVCLSNLRFTVMCYIGIVAHTRHPDAHSIVHIPYALLFLLLILFQFKSRIRMFYFYLMLSLVFSLVSIFFCFCFFSLAFFVCMRFYYVYIRVVFVINSYKVVRERFVHNCCRRDHRTFKL